MSSNAATQGAHHIGLTVPNLEETKAFFIETLGYAQVGERPNYPAVFVSDGAIMITLWQVSDSATAIAFDRKYVIGLHHLALKVESRAALDVLHRKVAAAAGVTIEFAPENLGDGPATHMMCTIPGGIRMEFIAV